MKKRSQQRSNSGECNLERETREEYTLALDNSNVEGIWFSGKFLDTFSEANVVALALLTSTSGPDGGQGES